MKIDADQHHNLRLKEVFSGVLLETEEGNQIAVCMRDDTLEINVCPGGKSTGNWWRVNMQNGKIESMFKGENVPKVADPLHDSPILTGDMKIAIYYLIKKWSCLCPECGRVNYSKKDPAYLL